MFFIYNFFLGQEKSYIDFNDLEDDVVEYNGG